MSEIEPFRRKPRLNNMVMVRMDDTDYTTLARISRDEERTMSEVARDGVRTYMNAWLQQKGVVVE